MSQNAVILRLALALTLLWPLPSHSQPLDGERLRAAMVYRLAQYTQWPNVPEQGLVLCSAGFSRDALASLTDRQWGGQSLRLREIENPRDVIGCQVLVLGHADAQTLRRWLQAVDGAAVLTIGTSAEALRAGVTIALISEAQGMAFSVNQGEARRHGLVLAAPVLKLAREIR